MKKYLLFYIVSLLLFGTNGIVAAAIPLESTQIVMLRTLIGAPLVIVVASASSKTRKQSVSRPSTRQILFIVASGACTGLSWVTLYEAYDLIGVGISSLEYYCAPVIVVIASVLVFGEKLTVPKALGFVCTLTGTFIVGGQAVLGGGSAWGLALGGISALCHAGMVIFSKKATDISGAVSCAVQLVLSCVIATFAIALTGGFAFLGEIPSSAWPAIVFLGLANTGIGCLIYFTTIMRLPAQTVATLGYLEPLSAVVFSSMLLGEGLSVAQWAGAALVLGGSMVSEHRTRSH